MEKRKRKERAVMEEEEVEERKNDVRVFERKHKTKKTKDKPQKRREGIGQVEGRQLTG